MFCCHFLESSSNQVDVSFFPLLQTLPLACQIQKVTKVISPLHSHLPIPISIQFYNSLINWTLLLEVMDREPQAKLCLLKHSTRWTF